MTTTATPHKTNGKTTAEPATGALGARSDSTDARLRSIETEVRNQGRTVRRAQRAWGIFAFFALIIAVGNLIAVATKLDGKSNSAAAPAAAAAAPATPATPAATPGTIGVSMKDFTVGPTPAEAPVGSVTFKVKNNGAVPHEFVVLRTDKPAGSLLKGAEADEAGNVGEIGDLKPGALKTLTLKLKAGHYALICNLPGHYRAGQHADFTVK
jgi:uncharacterized cupredoxin-like copper-binding protein